MKYSIDYFYDRSSFVTNALGYARSNIRLYEGRMFDRSPF